MGNDNRGHLVVGQFIHCLNQGVVAGIVETGVRLVENYQFWFTENRPGQSNSLPLTTGKRGAAVADLGLVAVGEAQN